MLPALMAKNSLGRPNCRQGSHECQSGWLSMRRETGSLQHSTQDGHGETGMIDVGIAGDENHVDLPPIARGHLLRVIGSGGAA